ncbi:MAG: pilus assembly protein TadG-related protein [Pseudonocardiales bacterium]
MRRATWRRADRGSMSVYVAVLAVPFLMIAGLVVDGGGALVAKQRAADEAGQAARAGANQLDLASVRSSSGARKIDPVLATKAIADYFALPGNSGSYRPQVSPDRVTVTVNLTYAPIVLPFLGRTYTATATAVPISK